MLQQSRVRIDYLATGGTIASLQHGLRPGASPTLTADDLAAAVPQLADYANVVSSQFSQLPSPSFTFPHLLELHKECLRRVEDGASGIVITQGTDTIEETAFFLDLLWDRPEPVVFSGAMRNPSLPGGDGPANLLAAVQVAASPQASNLGVLVVLNEEIHAARFVHKGHTFSASTFVSPGAGPIGWISEGRPHILTIPPRRQALAFAGTDIVPVALIRLSIGDDGRILDELVRLGYQGVVVEAFGGGHIPVIMLDSFRRLSRNLPVVLASRTGSGEVLSSTYRFPGSEIDLLAAGAISAGSLDGLKSRLLLALALSAGLDRDALNRIFQIYGTASENRQPPKNPGLPGPL